MKIAQWYHLSSVVCWANQNLVVIICIKQETLILIYFQYFSLMCCFIILVSDIMASDFRSDFQLLPYNGYATEL